MARYRFNDHEYSPEHNSWQQVLQKAYGQKLRPTCQCKQGDIAPTMYIAKFNQTFILKRMPFTAAQHAPHCEHYEPPPELSGLGQVNGSAIREDAENETTNLTLDFPLTKGRSRTPGQASEVEHESVRSDGTKLTLRAMLHYLYDQAGLTRWSPKMKGRRNWFIVRRELLNAAMGKKTKGSALSELLFIPETFFLENEGEIRSRLTASLSRLVGSPSNRMLLIAEVKSFEPARFGTKLTIKHVPSMPLMINDDLSKRLTKRFADQLALWDHITNGHLMLIGTFSLSPQGIHFLESACLMNVTETWLPFENMYEFELLQELHRQDRRFTKGLRYNLPTATPLASVVLQDTGDAPTAMYVVPVGADSAYEEAALKLNEQAHMQAWQWHSGHDAMPPLPALEVGQMEPVHLAS